MLVNLTWPATQHESLSSINCADVMLELKAVGSVVGNYNGILQRECTNGTLEQIDSANQCVPQNCESSFEDRFDAKGVPLSIPWPRANHLQFSSIDCFLYASQMGKAYTGRVRRQCVAGVLLPTADSCKPKNCSSEIAFTDYRIPVYDSIQSSEIAFEVGLSQYAYFHDTKHGEFAVFATFC